MYVQIILVTIIAYYKSDNSRNVEPDVTSSMIYHQLRDLSSLQAAA
jgi:hypothetical protein